jgi:transcriptional accessory protein Tex/SPT6
MTGDEYLHWLHERRAAIWREAKERGISTEQFVREIQERAHRARQAFLAKTGAEIRRGDE